MSSEPSQLTALLENIKPNIPQIMASDFALTDKESTAKWIEKLPKRNMASTAVELYKALPKISALNLDPVIKRDI